jgi:excisionase family DNA binding protein
MRTAVAPEPSSGDHLLTTDELCELCRMKRRHFFRMKKAGLGPREVRLGAKLVRFRASEVQRWLAALEKRGRP